ncbi:hypothetical protein Tco_0975374 [Tanacetum coccineum]|uniref:Uncharacterized protein n=1 Tax=Tanacetum coccineum TaxID=301880 RepID=A0ABQ5EEI4_9ASTR
MGHGRGGPLQVRGSCGEDGMQTQWIWTFNKYSTGLIPPKKSKGKGSQGKKPAVNLKPTSVEVSDESDPEPAKIRTCSRRLTGVVIQDTSNIPKKKSVDHSQKLKADESTDTFKTSSEGTGIKPGVPDKDSVPVSPGKTYSSSSNNSFGLVLIASPTLSLFHDEPIVFKEFFLPEELLPLKKRGCDRSFSSTSALPQAFEIGESSLDEYAIRNKIIESKTLEKVVSKSKINRDEVIIEDLDLDDMMMYVSVQHCSFVKHNKTQAVRSQS